MMDREFSVQIFRIFLISHGHWSLMLVNIVCIAGLVKENVQEDFEQILGNITLLFHSTARGMISFAWALS